MPSLSSEIREKWKPRNKHTHKGDCGRIFIVAGSKGFSGAPHLAAMGALRTGGGLITLGVPDKIYSVTARREAEIMVKPFASNSDGVFSPKAVKPILDFLDQQDVLAIGPGLSQTKNMTALVLSVLKKSRVPLILDADALNVLQGHLRGLEQARYRSILTPHPGEFKKLFNGKSISNSKERVQAAKEIAKKYKIVMVLKGHETVVANPEGDCYINQTGNPGMATGGMGDVLTGMIAALIGQGFSLWDSARFGVYLHGLAGDLAAKRVGEVSLTPSDVLEDLSKVILKIRGR